MLPSSGTMGLSTRICCGEHIIHGQETDYLVHQQERLCDAPAAVPAIHAVTVPATTEVSSLTVMQ